MKATDLIKSISNSSITSEDMKVITAYQNQDLEQFMHDNFGSGITDKLDWTKFEMPFILFEQHYLAVYNNVMLATPDGKSVLKPDCVVTLEDKSTVELYKFN